MTFEIGLVLGIVVLAIILFVTERIPLEVVALMVLVTLALTRLVTPAEALSGFSSPAVVTVWAVFILSGGLSRTGVAALLGRQVLRLAGRGEARLVAVIMLTAGVLSAFMNNVGVAALLLPVVMDIARRTGRPPSRLLIPLASGSLLGGLNTLIGTPPNILVSDALRDYGLPPFRMFDFALTGLPILLAGVAFMVLVGRHLLPTRDPAREELAGSDARNLRQLYGLQERLFVLRLPEESALAGQTLAASRLGAVLGLHVVAILRDRRTQLAPTPDTVLKTGDRLLVQGRPDRLARSGRCNLEFEDEPAALEKVFAGDLGTAEVRLAPDAALVGQTLSQGDLRRRVGVNVLAVRRGDTIRRAGLRDMLLQAGDILLVQGSPAALQTIHDTAGLEDFRLVSGAEVADIYHLHERLVALHVLPGSRLVGQTLAESRLGEAFGLMVLSIQRGSATHPMPGPEERLQADDTLFVEGRPEDLASLRGLEDLEVVRQSPADPDELESERVGLAEVVLSPHTTLVGRTPQELHFREKYGLSVLAVWREGRAYRSNLRDMALRLGDALLLYGPRDRLAVLGGEPDFLVLTQAAQEGARNRRAPVAVLVMAGVLLPVILGWVPIAIAAVAGAVLMVLTRCLTISEAYRYIEWKAVFLIAGMLPLGIAMENTKAASLLAEGLVGTVGGWGSLAVVAGIFALGVLGAQIMPTAAVAVLLSPIVLRTAEQLDLSPYTLMMVLAMAASASFLSPVAHPANVLIMGPGGYRFSDYIKVGLPLTLVVLAVLLVVLPIFWPL